MGRITSSNSRLIIPRYTREKSLLLAVILILTVGITALQLM